MLEFDVIQWGGYFGFTGPATFRTSVGPIADDQHVLVEAKEADTVASVLHRAARFFGVQADDAMFPGVTLESGLYWTAFFKPEHLDPAADPHITVIHDLVGVNANGLAYWASFTEVECGDLLRAAKANLVDGDPSRPYLIPWVPQGGIGPSDWHAVLNVLAALRDIANLPGPLLNVYAIIDIIRRTVRRLHGAGRAIEENSTDWSKRGGGPREVFALLALRPWKSEELANLLGCTRPEAEAMLWGWGCHYDAQKSVWMREDSAEAGLVDLALNLALHDRQLSRAEAQVQLNRALELYSAEGELPSLPDVILGNDAEEE